MTPEESDWKRGIDDDDKVDQLQPFIKAIEAQKVGNQSLTKLPWAI